MSMICLGDVTVVFDGSGRLRRTGDPTRRRPAMTGTHHPRCSGCGRNRDPRQPFG